MATKKKTAAGPLFFASLDYPVNDLLGPHATAEDAACDGEKNAKAHDCVYVYQLVAVYEAEPEIKMKPVPREKWL